jgi:hypothetical protein
MKTHLRSPNQTRRGVALILTVLFLVFVAIFLATYLFVAQGEYITVARSQTWNVSLVLAEAGVEDALAFLNKNVGVYGAIAEWTNATSSDGWYDVSTGGKQIYYLERRSPDTNLGFYSVYITNKAGGGAAILSTGVAYWNTNAGPKVGGSNVMVSYKNNTVRKIFMQTKLEAMVPGNLVSVTNTTFNGNGVTIDSFDSADPLHSNWQTTMTYHGTNFYGIYPYSNPMDDVSFWDPKNPYRRKANALVATDGQLITVQNANIAGYVNTGPGGTAALQNNGAVGDVRYVFVTPKAGIQDGHARDDMNIIFPDVQLPKVTWTNLTVQIHGPKASRSTNYWISAPGYYAITNDINGKTGTTDPVKTTIEVVATNVVLYLPTGLNYAGSGNTLYVSNNCDLTLYLGKSMSLNGNGSVNNATQYAPALSVFGLPTCNAINLGGNMAFTGYVYAPQADLDTGGGGATTYDAVGAFFVRSIKFGGGMNFHYDEQLLNVGLSRGYIPVMWQEVP